MWIGGRQLIPAVRDVNWVWDMSGMPVNETLWARNQPNNYDGNQDHICLYQGDNGLHDINQFGAYVFLCETEYLLC